MLNPTDPTLIERDKYKKFVEEQIRTKQLLAQKGYEVDEEEVEQQRPVSTSISQDMKQLILGGLLALLFVCVVIFCVIYCFKWWSKPSKKNMIDREAELAEIRRNQQLNNQHQGAQRKAYWKDANGLEPVDEEGESYITHYSDYRKSNPLTADWQYNSAGPDGLRGQQFFNSNLSGGIIDNYNDQQLQEPQPANAPAVKSNKFTNRYQYQEIDDEDNDEDF